MKKEKQVSLCEKSTSMVGHLFGFGTNFGLVRFEPFTVPAWSRNNVLH